MYYCIYFYHWFPSYSHHRAMRFSVVRPFAQWKSHCDMKRRKWMAETGKFWKWSLQVVELWAVAMAFQHFPGTPLNIVTDSAYIAGVIQKLHWTLLKEIDNARLFSILKGLWPTIQAIDCSCCILHVRSSTTLPGFIAEGNAWAECLVSPGWTATQPATHAQAKASHAFFHQGMRALQRQFVLSNSEVCNTVNSCSDCQGHKAPPHLGVNPHGLRDLQIWQTGD